MKTLFLLFSLSFCIFLCASAQSFKATYDPSYKTEEGSGFYTDFEFNVTGYDTKAKATTILLSSINTDLNKGWYKKIYSSKAKLYPCDKLQGLCTTTAVSGFWIRLEWEYNGKVYENGGQFTGYQRGDKFNFINEKNYFNPPSEIPFAERSKAIIKKISVTSCSYTTSNEIYTLLLKIK